MYRYISRRSNSVIFIIIYFPSQEGFTIKEKNLLLLLHIVSFMSKPRSGRAMLVRGANRKSRKLFPLEKMTDKHGGVPIHFYMYGPPPCFVAMFAMGNNFD